MEIYISSEHEYTKKRQTDRHVRNGGRRGRHWECDTGRPESFYRKLEAAGICRPLVRQCEQPA